MFLFFSCVPELQTQLSNACQQSWLGSIFLSSRVWVFVTNFSHSGTFLVSWRKRCSFSLLLFYVSSPRITFFNILLRSTWTAKYYHYILLSFAALLCSALWSSRDWKEMWKRRSPTGSGFWAFSCYPVGAVLFTLCPYLGWPSGAGRRSLLLFLRTACFFFFYNGYCVIVAVLTFNWNP